MLSLASTKVTGTFLPRSMARRNSVFPSGCIPKIDIKRPAESTPKKQKKKKMDKGFLEPPKWRYKEIKDEKKKEKKAEKEKKEQEKKEKRKEKSDKKAKK